MKRFRFAWIASLIVSSVAGTAAQADDADRRFYVSPLASGVTQDDERGSDYGVGAQIAVGKRLTQGLELELLGTYTNYKDNQHDFEQYTSPKPSHSHLYGAGLGANIFLAPSSDGVLKGLFLHLDVQREQAHKTAGEVRAYTGTMFEPGLGYDFLLTKEPFGPFAQGIALRTEFLYRLDSHSPYDIGNSVVEQHHYFQEGVFNIGLRIPLGGRPLPVAQPAEAPAEVVAVPETPPEEPAPAPEPPPPPPCQAPTAGEPISLEGCKTGDTIVLRGVNFNFDKATLTANAQTILDQVADALLARMDIKVELDGHTDGKGSVNYNQKLSDHRAASVKDYLVGRGVAADRITTKGFGKSMPIADNKTDEGRELNRRVELKVTDSAGGVTTSQPGEATAPAAPPSADATTPAPDAAAPAPADAAPVPADSSATPPADSSTPAADSSTPAADSSSTPPPADSSSTTTPAPADASTPPADSSADLNAPK